MPKTATAVDCGNCGQYTITHLLESAWIRERHRVGNNNHLNDEDEVLLPYLAAAVRRSPTPIALTAGTWREIAVGMKGIPISQKLRQFLDILAQRSVRPGAWVPFGPEEACPLLALGDEDEYHYLRRHLLASELVDTREMGGTYDTYGKNIGTVPGYSLTARGWETVAPLSGGVQGTCFVAMSFDESLAGAYEFGFAPSIVQDCGFSVTRIDRVEHNDSITDRILAGIRSAQFVVADFTLQRPGVYYEAGFAQGLGKSVVWTCREDDLGRLHFDTRQYNHVAWKTPDELRTKLTDRIRATIPGSRFHL